MIKRTCPVCKGNKKIVAPIRFNGIVDPQKHYVEQVCWLCDGVGEVIEQVHNKNIHLHKYWKVGDEDARKEVSFNQET